MTEHEAIMIIQAIPEKIWNQMDKVEEEAIAMTVAACEKQIAKELKIIESDVIISGQIYHDDYYHCPCCNKCFGALWYVEDNAKTLKTKCCPDCGQVLDWE